MTPERFNAVVLLVNETIDASPKSFIQAFDSSSKENLIEFHHGMGTSIRNEYKLWEEPWEPELRDGVDYSPHHPDSISMTIIEAVWELRRLKDKNELK